MNRALVDPIANAVLYEGYIVYPYRPALKNRHRWTIGGLYPEEYRHVRGGGEASSLQTECLIEGGPATLLEGTVRFLHLIDRQVGEVDQSASTGPAGAEPQFRPVKSLRVGEELFQRWQKAVERECVLPFATLSELVESPRRVSFHFPGRRTWKRLDDQAGDTVGILIREQKLLEGVVELSINAAGPGFFRLTLCVANTTPITEPQSATRDQAALRSMVSTHVILRVDRGRFVSLLDPPDRWRDAAAACRNVGVWPVLVGEPGRDDTMLASPIILYDYPQVAPESPGDFFDGTEIDEMLTLRIMTLSDDEKALMAAVDRRARALLERTEASASEQLRNLHGTIRGLRVVAQETAHE
jgi:hydrogenase maturation protease